MYPDRERSSDLSPETPESSNRYPVDAVATSELPTAVKTTSIVALIAVILMTLVGSLAVSPRPSVMEAEEEIEEAVATDEPALEEMEEEMEEVVTTPATSLTEDETTTADTGIETETETETMPLETDGTATPESPTPVADEVDPTDTATAPETTEEPTTAVAPSPETTTSDATTTPEPDMAETMPGTESETMATDGAGSPTDTGATGAEMAEMPETTADTTPTSEAPGEEMAAAPATVDAEQLNQIVYDKLDRAWTLQGTPVTADVSYIVTVTPEGAIAEFEPKSPDASDNVENTPLPELLEADGMTGETSGQTVKFEVVFSDTGALEVKPSQ